MKQVDRNTLYQRLKKQAYNSSHYVWLWSDLQFFESKNGWIFGITKELGVHLVALEPLPPLNSDDLLYKTGPGLAEALIELRQYCQSGTIAFVGINTSFAKKLADFGYVSFQVGKEPWVDLADIKPTGYAGRKVRVGRNQAMKIGLRVEEIKLTEVIKDPKKLAALNEVKNLWEAQSLVSLSGFLHGVSFDSIPQDRRCFIALTSDDMIAGILIVTPIEDKKSWYFEDMLNRADSEVTKGVGELLVLMAMEVLQEDGFQEISLGVVPMTSVGVSDFGEAPPKNFLRLTNFFESFMGLFYNASGMELFRKRFKVARWDKIYLSILTEKNDRFSGTWEWIKVLLAIALAYKPHFQLKSSFVIEKITSPLRRFPTSAAVLLVSIVSYLVLFTLPMNVMSNTILSKLVFSANAPLWQWPLRTLSSQLMHVDSLHFWIFYAMIAASLFYIEKEVFDKKWAAYLLSFFVANEIITRTMIGFLFKVFPAFKVLLGLAYLFPTQGPAILLFSLLGFVSIFFGIKKDEVFSLGVLVFIALSFVVPFFGIPSIALFYGLTFFVEGYLVGKYYLVLQSKKDALVSKNKKVIFEGK